MRLKLSLQLDQRPQLLPLNYKYPVSSWIYHTIEKSDSNMAIKPKGVKLFDYLPFLILLFHTVPGLLKATGCRLMQIPWN
jgi:CRISPR/Cas system endoribonuclease Cas6 (RAMP superfamily)